MIVDVDHSAEKYARAEGFVKARNLAYNLSSPFLSKLGGSEVARLPELYAGDYEWTGDIITRMPPQRITIQLNEKAAPLACQNFRALCTGDKGKGKSGCALHFKGCKFFRIIKGFMAQCGDLQTNTGAGGESIFGKKFKDDRGGLKQKLGRRGLVAMCNSGKNSNT